MNQTITRKYLIKKLPDLSGKKKVVQERCYLYVSDKTVIRLQSFNEEYQIERKTNLTELVREEQRIAITKEEYEELKNIAKFRINRDSYDYSGTPKIVIRIYHDNYEGLIRVEVSFSSEKEALAFEPLNWFGKEISENPIAQDGHLLELSKEEFRSLLKN